MGTRRKLITSVKSFAGAGSVVVALAAPAYASSMATGVSIDRKSGNGCAEAHIGYKYEAEGSTYRISYAGENVWHGTRACGVEQYPYDAVLQWKGVRIGTPFGRTTAPDGYKDDPRLEPVSGFKDVRFRSCNWNTVTGAIGTCGSG